MLQRNASWWLSCLPKGWRPMRSFHWIWCFNDLYFSSKSGVKAIGKASHILDTNKNTHTVSLELAKSPSYKKNSHLMLATEAQLPRSSLQWRPWDRMKAWARRTSALGILHALPGHTEGWRYFHPDGQHLPQSRDCPQNSKGTANDNSLWERSQWETQGFRCHPGARPGKAECTNSLSQIPSKQALAGDMAVSTCKGLQRPTSGKCSTTIRQRI